MNNFFLYKSKILFFPYFISITYNFNNKLGNINIIKYFLKKKINIMPHIICTNINLLDFKNNLYFYHINNIKRILILKGDENINNYYSYNLINLIKIIFKKFFFIYSALYCEFHNNSFNYKSDIKNSFIKTNFSNIYNITQYFYNIDSYLYFIDDIKKIKIKKIKLIPGVMPIFSINQIIKFSNTCKSEIPNWIVKRLNNFYLNINDFKIITNDILINLIFKLLNLKIKFIHFYTMNDLKNLNIILNKILLSNNV